jgi:hypothetical protein
MRNEGITNSNKKLVMKNLKMAMNLIKKEGKINQINHI